ncbi:hypothetical protein FA15DRAFT_714061 [Coprinopsis marcescibilis]|uniref:Uncharacterized protein n=1 Tax=Coprinopsis marcescibilis TaxID=230819 RepID=A0A5C3L721_COPMA|nr:hypothetical protein FA15DRAFT_714061 [Coprinopsis marcescibilis]
MPWVHKLQPLFGMPPSLSLFSLTFLQGRHRRIQALPITHLSLRGVHVSQAAGAVPAVSVFHRHQRFQFESGDLPICLKAVKLHLQDALLVPLLHRIFSNPKKLDLESMEELTFYRGMWFGAQSIN